MSIAALLRTQPLLRLFAINAAIGFALSGVFVGALLGFNPGGFRDLALHQAGGLAAVLLWFFIGLTFSSVHIGVAVMNLTKPKDPPGGGKKARVEAAPARVRAP